MLKSGTNIAVFCAFLLVMAFLAVVLWQALFPSEETEEKAYRPQETHAEQQGDPKKSIGINPSPRVHNPTEQAIADYTRWLAIFTALLVLATIALFVSGERNVEVARESSKAARESADAARAAVNLAERTAEQQLRAYVFADSQEIRKFGFDETPEGWLFFKNSGATPAFDFERGAKLMYTKFPATEFPEIEWGGAKGYLAPHGEIFFGPIPLPRALTATETANVTAGTYAIYLYGKVKYVDAFRKPHLIEFRSFFRGNGRPPAGPVLATQQDNEGNTGD